MDKVEEVALRRATRIKAPPRSQSATSRVVGMLVFVTGVLYAGLWTATHYWWPRVFPQVQAGETRNDVLLRIGPPTGSRHGHGEWRGWGTGGKVDDAPQTDAWRSLPPGAPTVYVVQYDDMGVVLKSFTKTR